jgi:hypothetical protein
MADGLLSIIAAVVAAAAGAAAGSVGALAISRIRKERGFDRQLEWCESMMKALNAAGAAVTSATMGDDPEAREECWTQAIRLYEDLIPLCGLKELYAPEPAVEMIQRFMSEFEKLLESHLASHRPNALTADCDGEACLMELRRAAGSLAGLARDHLKLGRLPSAITDSKRRFLGSFRGRKLDQHRAAFQ